MRGKFLEFSAVVGCSFAVCVFPELAGPAALAWPVNARGIVPTCAEVLRYLEQLVKVPDLVRLSVVLLSLKMCFSVSQDLGWCSLPALYLLNGLSYVHPVAICLLSTKCTMGNLPIHLVILSHSVGHKRLVQALLLPHPLEELRDVLLDLSVLLRQHLLVLSRRVRRVRGQLLRHWQLRRIPLQIAFFPSFSSGLRVGHVCLRSGVAALFLVRRQPLRKEVPRVAIYLI